MTAFVMLVVLVTAGVVAARVTLGILAQRWGVGSRGDVCSWAGAMVIPLPGRTSSDLVRVIGRRLGGLRYLTPSGTVAAYPYIEVLVGSRSAAGLFEQCAPDVLERELRSAYLAVAGKQGWQLPDAGVRIVVTTDDRLADGRVFLDGRWAPRQTAGVADALWPSSEQIRGEQASGDGGTRLYVDDGLDLLADGTVLLAEPDTVLLVGDNTVGVAPALRVTVDGREHMLLAGSRHVLGRDVNCAVTVTDPSVSRQHAQVWDGGDAWWLRDLSSHNGTSVDGAPLTEPVRLTGPVTVRLGACELLLTPTVVPQPAGR